MADEKQQNDADLIIKERNEVNEKDQGKNAVQDEDENSGEKQDFDNDIKLYELTIGAQVVEVKPEFQEALEECKDELTRAMDFLKNTDDLKNEQVLSSVEMIKNSYYNTKLTTYRPLLGEHLCNIGFPELFIKFWIEINKLNIFDPENEQEMKVLKAMKSLAWNYSDASIKLCAELGKFGAVPLLLSSLKQKELVPETLTNPNIIHVKGSLGILNNMVRLHPHNIQLLRDNNAVKLLLDYTAVKFLILKANCFMIISFLITDEEVSLLENTGIAVRFIIDLLTTSLTAGKARGYSTLEILLSLNNLALNDENKVKIVEYNGLAQLGRALKKRTKSILILSAMLIWKLSFIEQNRKRIREDESLINVLKLNKSSDVPKVQATCSGALWEIFGGQPEVNEDSTPIIIQPYIRKGTHVMISYQWDVQPRIIKLKKKLQDAGYIVWMDIDQIEGDILGAMAAAVENAAVFLPCISKKYKDSTSCRTEATYAYKQKKSIIPLIVEEDYVPDGWLGALIGTLIYFHLFNDSKLDTEFQRIISEIGNRGKQEKGHKRIHRKEIVAVSTSFESSSNNRGVDSADNPVAPTSKVLLPKVKADISNWTSNDVKKWLKEIKLEECSSAMKDVDGDILTRMYTMSKEAPDFFYSRLERDFSMIHLMQILKFSSALEKLLC
ncbi:uncharacterized protein LOC117108331 [Anneissia japonica]|uniref:uncharacterized protein LOC117108331 n=1 Tax=Anneissia japonica TaxID=1529436 RepID=UPI001425A8D5|nr:uncharacterized protein LOC117108331 [Anneissia japonica]XP_033106206.1 uncharacterized protein LOC117108331 [Anneissia japonica]XP_033106207.1 uncharacterized protein LOC117108331 [Anneissia japonica]